MARKMKRTFTICLTLYLALMLLPAVFAEGQGWRAEDGGWRYYMNGAPLKIVNWIEAVGNFYIFDNATGLLETGDADGDVLMNGNLYYINPNKNLSNPASCYAVRNYTRTRSAGVTYYDSNGITFVGWMSTADGGRMYQTLIRKEDIGAAKDLYIYVWRGQHLPAGIDPITREPIPAGWYLFGEDGVLMQEAGWHDSEDLCAYRTNEQGLILEKGPRGTNRSPAPATKDIPAMIEAAHAYAHSRLSVIEKAKNACFEANYIA